MEKDYKVCGNPECNKLTKEGIQIEDSEINVVFIVCIRF